MADVLLKVEDVAEISGVAASTIRKYSVLIEKQGYEFSRSFQNSLIYDQSEVDFFKELIQLKKQKGMTIESAIQELLPNISDTAPVITDTTKDVSAMTENMAAMLLAMSDMQQQMKLILDQNNLLMNKVEQLEGSEKKQIGDRDKLLMESIKETKELKEAIIENQNKKWWKFGK